MKINEIIGEWMIMPQSIKPMGLIRKPGGGFDFKNKGNNRANEKAPPGREKQVKALKGKVDNPYAVAWAQHNKHGKPKNEAPIEQDHNNPIAKPYVDMPEWKALHDMDDKIIDAYIKHKKESVNEDPRAVGQAVAILDYGAELAQAILKKADPLQLENKAKTYLDKVDSVRSNLDSMYRAEKNRDFWLNYKDDDKKEDAAGVGIITKQNTTQDVKPGDEYKNVKKLHLR